MMHSRWDPYYLARDDQVIKFWTELRPNNEGRILYILGRGFDPRAVIGVKRMLQSSFSGYIECLAIDMAGLERTEEEGLRELADANFNNLTQILTGRGQLRKERIETWIGDPDTKERTGPDKALRLITPKLLEGFTDVVLDISALPRGIYFPMLAQLIRLCTPKADCTVPSLHAFVAEDVNVDNRIEERGLEEDAYFVPPFRASMEIQSESPIIWMPMLGENQLAQVTMVQSLVRRYAEDLEVCPVLPMPARNPRRADNLIRRYSEFLASGWENDSRNFVYVSEQNPFQTYRHLVHSSLQYNDALDPIGGCRIVISSHSSKLLSLGALLAAYELKEFGMQVGLANVDATSYSIKPPEGSEFNEADVVPFLLSLAGVAYEP